MNPPDPSPQTPAPGRALREPSPDATHPSPIIEACLHGNPRALPIIDVHSHPDRFRSIFFPVVEPSDMASFLDRAGVVMVCGVTHESLFADVHSGNDRMERLVRRYPRNFRGYVGVNPHYPEKITEELARYDSRRGFIGFKFLSTYHEVAITGDANVPVFEFADARGLVVLSHTWGKNDLCRPELFVDLAARYRNVTWLLGHAGYGDWRIAAEIARDHPNIFLELTGACCVGGVIDLFVEIAGSEKVIFGTDFPWFDPHYGVGTVLFSRITDHDRQNILYNNAAAILKRVGVDLDHPDRL